MAKCNIMTLQTTKLLFRPVLAAALAITLNAEAAASYSLADDFSITSNGGTNPWSYGFDNVAGEPVEFVALTNISHNANELWGTDFANPPLIWSSDLTEYGGIAKNQSGVVQTSSSGITWNPGEVLLRPKTTAPFPGRLVIAWIAPTYDTASNVVNVRFSFSRALPTGGVGCSLIKRASGVDKFLVGWTGPTSAGAISNALTRLALMPGDQLFWRIDSWGSGVEDDITKAFIHVEIVPGTPGQTPEPYASLTPKQTFSNILAEQESQLGTNELMLRFASSRKKLAADRYRPVYHFVSPESQMNDPNGLCFWKGRWHLFYQAYPPDEYPDPVDIPKRRQHWGHAVSLDLVHWRDLPYAIYPGIEKMCFSGSTVVESNQVVAYYPGIAAGQMVAVATDPLLLNWQKLPDSPVNSPAGDSCIWKEGNVYYGLVGADHLVTSTDLANWTSLGGILEANPFPMGDAYACPGFVPIGSKHLLTSFSHIYGGQYMLGDYNQQNHKFTPYAKGLFNHGRVSPGGVHAPSVAADGRGGAINILNINDGKHSDDWDQIMSLAQQLTLGPDSQLRIAPVSAVSSLRSNHQHVGQTVLPANQEIVLNQIQGNAMELDVEIDPAEARWVQLNVLRSPNAEEQTSITFFNFDRALSIWYFTPGEIVLDGSRSSMLTNVWLRPPERTVMPRAPGETLRLRVFVDRSVVEVFVNERQYLAMRVYPNREDSVGVSLQAQGQDAVLKRLDAWNMNPITLGGSVIEPDVAANQAYSGQLLPVGGTFAKVTGPDWLTIYPDGSMAGTPGVADAGSNLWLVSLAQGSGEPTLVQLQITVIGKSLFTEDFKSYIGNQNSVQWQTGLKLAYDGNVTGWTKVGGGAVHAVDRANASGESNPSDWAAMMWQDNIITSSPMEANNAGVSYVVAFRAGPTVYAEAQSSQATAAGDGIVIDVLRPNDTVLASYTNRAGAWAGSQSFGHDSFVYVGDGAGSTRLRVKSLAAGSGRFGGAIDNITVSEAASQPQALNIREINVNPINETLSIGWASTLGMRYDLLSHTNLAAPLAEWPLYKFTNIIATPPENTLILTSVPMTANRFYSIRALPVQP